MRIPYNRCGNLRRRRSDSRRAARAVPDALYPRNSSPVERLRRLVHWNLGVLRDGSKARVVPPIETLIQPSAEFPANPGRELPGREPALSLSPEIDKQWNSRCEPAAAWCLLRYEISRFPDWAQIYTAPTRPRLF